MDFRNRGTVELLSQVRVVSLNSNFRFSQNPRDSSAFVGCRNWRRFSDVRKGLRNSCRGKSFEAHPRYVERKPPARFIQLQQPKQLWRDRQPNFTFVGR